MIPRQIVLYASLGAAVVIALLLAWALRLDHLRAGYKSALDKTITRYEQAQKDAQADFDLKIITIKARNEKANQDADAKADASSIVYRDRVVRLPAAPAQCPAAGSGLPRADIPESADRPGGDSIILERKDALICAANQSRLEAAHAWALDMAKGN